MSNINETLRSYVPKNGIVAKLLTILYVLMAFVSTFMLGFYSSTAPQSLIGILLFVLSICIFAIATTSYDNIYMMPRKHNAKLDERQLQVRRRIFEKSYGVAYLMVCSVFIILALKRTILLHMNSFLPFTEVLILFAYLPSLFAVWERDS